MSRARSAAAYDKNGRKPIFHTINEAIVGLNPHDITGSFRLTADFPSAVLYRVTETDDTIKVTADLIELPEGKKLEAMQAAVGGKVEFVHLGNSRHRRFVTYDGWVNEEGVLLGLPVGLSVHVARDTRHVLLPCAGSMLVTAGESLSGETVPLTPDEIKDLVLLTMGDGKLPVVSVTPELKDA